MKPSTIITLIFASTSLTSAAVTQGRDTNEKQERDMTPADFYIEMGLTPPPSIQVRAPEADLMERAGTPIQPAYDCIACMASCLAVANFTNWWWRQKELPKSALGTWASCGYKCTVTDKKCFASYTGSNGQAVTSETGQMNNYMEENGWWTD